MSNTSVRRVLLGSCVRTTLTRWVCEKVRQQVGSAYTYPVKGSKHFEHVTHCISDLLTGKQKEWPFVEEFATEHNLHRSLLSRKFTVEEVVEGLVRVAQCGVFSKSSVYKQLGNALCVPSDTYVVLKRKKLHFYYSPFLLVWDPVFAGGNSGVCSLLPVSRAFFDELLQLLRIPQDNSQYAQNVISKLKLHLIQLDKFRLFSLKTEQFFQTGMYTGVAFPKKSLEGFLVQYVEWLKDRIQDIHRMDIACFSIYSRMLADFLAEQFPAQKPWMPVSGVFVLQVYRTLVRSGAVVCVASRALPADVVQKLPLREWKAKARVLTQKWAYVPCSEKFYHKLCSISPVPLLYVESNMLRIQTCNTKKQV